MQIGRIHGLCITLELTKSNDIKDTPNCSVDKIPDIVDKLIAPLLPLI